MKIICSGCGAKHWLSDMQLSDGGCNVVCPHCQTTNFADASMVDPSSLEPRWYYAVNEESVGPLSTRDLEFAFQNGQLTLDSYVWCDGLSDWMALGSVPEFDYLVSPVQGTPAGMEEATRVAGGGQGGFASYPGPSSFGRGGDETSALDMSGSGFSPFDNASSGIVGMDGQEAKDDEPVFSMGMSQPSPAANNMVGGARSENSVLFSLSSLQAVSAASASPSVPTTAGGDAGFVDVKALASASPAPRRRNEVVDSFGGSAVPMATVLPLGNKKDNTMLIAILVGIGILVIVMGVVLAVVLTKDTPAPVAQQESNVDMDKAKASANDLGVAPAAVADNTQIVDKNKQAEEEAAKKKAEEEAAKKKAEEEAAKKAEEEKQAEEEAAKKAEEEKQAEEEAAKKAEEEKKAAADTKKADTKKADTKTETKKAETKKADTKKADTKKADTKKADAKPAAGGGGASLSKAEVQGVIRGIGAQVRTCSRTSAKKGTMKVSFNIKGDGRVSNARVVSPEFANTPTASCVLKVVNGMKFRATGGADVPITYPFAIQ